MRDRVLDEIRPAWTDEIDSPAVGIPGPLPDGLDTTATAPKDGCPWVTCSVSPLEPNGGGPGMVGDATTCAGGPDVGVGRACCTSMESTPRSCGTPDVLLVVLLVVLPVVRMEFPELRARRVFSTSMGSPVPLSSGTPVLRLNTPLAVVAVDIPSVPVAVARPGCLWPQDLPVLTPVPTTVRGNPGVTRDPALAPGGSVGAGAAPVGAVEDCRVSVKRAGALQAGVFSAVICEDPPR